MEYVDRLLARGERYPELASRLEAAITTALRTARERAGNLPGTALPRTEPTELPEAAAELIAATAGQLMFGELSGRLSAGARSLLARAAAFRGPVAAGTAAARPAQIAECEAAGAPSWPAIRPCARRSPSTASRRGTCSCSARARVTRSDPTWWPGRRRCAACLAAAWPACTRRRCWPASGRGRPGSMSASSRRTGPPATGRRSPPTCGPAGRPASSCCVTRAWR